MSGEGENGAAVRTGIGDPIFTGRESSERFVRNRVTEFTIYKNPWGQGVEILKNTLFPSLLGNFTFCILTLIF